MAVLMVVAIARASSAYQWLLLALLAIIVGSVIGLPLPKWKRHEPRGFDVIEKRDDE